MTQGPISVRDLTIAFDGVPAVHDVDLDVGAGEFVCLLGPSGCGKSTLLAALAGHVRAERGRIELDGRVVEGPDPSRGLVFQQHTLFPWLRVIDNVAYGLRMQGVEREARHRRAQEMLARVGLDGYGRHFPRELSGGMQQRVEIARVLVNQPRVLLMDEPFAALDALTRLRMQELLLDLRRQLAATVVFVTHDIDEALFLGDRLLVMSARPGRIVENLPVGAPGARDADWLTSPTFSRLKRRCLDLLRPDQHARLP